jgi:type VI secretion system protein ImpL
MPTLPFSLMILQPLVALALLMLLVATSKATLRRIGAPAPTPAIDEAKDSASEPAIRTIERAAKGLTDLTGWKGGIDSVPLLVVVGADTTMLSRLIPELGQGGGPFAKLEQTLQRGDCRFALGPDGAVASFGDGLLGSDRWESRWNELLRALVRTRRDQPFDGLVMAIPAEQLVGPARLSEEALMALGDRLYSMIWAAQRIGGWRVPVYLIITGGEALTGFDATVTRLAASARRGAMGWASPYGLDTAFERRWVSEGVEALAARLSALQALLLMRVADVDAAERILLFPSAVASLATPLRVLLTCALRTSAYHQPFMFRGLYLIGREETAAESESSLDAFASRLFTDRLFPEHVLAQPIEGAMTRRQQRIRMAQAGLAVAVLLGLFGIMRVRNHAHAVTTVSALVAKVGQLQGALLQTQLPTAYAIPRGSPGGASQVDAGAATALLRLMAGVTLNNLETPWAPLSYVTNASAGAQTAIRVGYQLTVLRAIHDQLIGAIPNLLGVPPAGAPDADPASTVGAATGADGRDVVALQQLLARVQQYGQALQEYQSLPQYPNIATLTSLLDYALQLQLPAGFATNYQLYKSSLQDAVEEPLPIATIQETVGGIVQQQALAAISATYQASPLARAIDEAVTDSTATDSDSPTTDELIRLRRLDAALHAIAADAPMPAYDWVAGPDGSPALNGILDVLATLAGSSDGNMALILPDVPQSLRAAAETSLKSTRLRLAQAKLFGGTSILAITGGKVTLTPQLQLALATLDAFLSQPLVTTPIPQRPAANDAGSGPLLWDSQGLLSLQGVAEGYVSFAEQNLSGSLPQSLRDSIEAAAGQRIRMLIQNAIAQAATAGSAIPFGQSDGEAALREEIGDLANAVPVMTNLRVALNQSQQSRTADQLDGLLFAQATRLLGRVDALLTAAAPYQLADPTLSFWTGTPPLAAPAFGAAGLADLIATLPARRDYVETLSRDYASPLVAYLQQSGVVPTGTSEALLARWQAIATTLAAHDQGNEVNSLSRLEQFISSDMDTITLANCRQTVGSVGAGSDWFGQQLQNLHRTVLDRCAAVMNTDTASDYANLAAAFDQTLAGRFPFGSPSEPDADPGDVKRFFSAYGPMFAGLQAQLVQLPAYNRAGAAQFVADLAQDQTALAPLLANPAPDATLSYTATIDFRTNIGSDPGANQIAAADVEVGQQTVSSFSANPSIAWTSGQPVQVRLHWATNAPSEPITTPDPGPQVSSREVSFSYSGDWALLRMLAAQRPDPATLAQLWDRRPETVEFTVALRPNPQAASGGQVGLATAQLFMRFGLTATLKVAGQPAQQIAIILPNFPTAAPPPPAAPMPLYP